MRNACMRAQIGAMTVVLLLASAGVALCQRGDPSQMVDRQVSAMKDRLKLTDEQVPKVKTILTDQFKKMAELRQKYPMQQGERPSEEAMNEMRKLREDTNKKMAEVLTKDQMTEYQKMMEERRGGARKGGGQPKQ